MHSARPMSLILASHSAGRAALLRAAGYRFRQIPSDIHEPDAPHGAHLERYVMGLACAKAAAVADRFPDAIVIGADTALIFHRTVIGKPRSIGEAAAILTRLSGHTHRISSAACVISPPSVRGGRRRIARLIDTAFVTFHAWPEARIRRFAALTRPLSWAGAYAVQDPHSAAIVRCIRGDLSTVIGLPLAGLDRELRKALAR